MTADSDISSPLSGAAVSAPKITTGPSHETVLDVHHWTDRLFSFRMTRPQTFRFRSGEFVMIGLEVDGKPLMRAYSIASPFWDEGLDFYSIKVPDGPLTSRLQKIAPGDKVILGKKSTGTLVLDVVSPAKRLYLFSTGTGIAPFASLIRDPETYEKFDQVILTQTCARVADLAYGFHICDVARHDELVGDEASSRLVFYTSVTREPYDRTQRITELMDSGQLYRDLGVPPLDPQNDRAMICGSMAMLVDIKARLEAAGLLEGANSQPGHFAVERAFVG
jgi:ferredoxin--NADP+ reductase